ncbi:MFS transporter [Ammoniphilus sp. 3BR4]
MKASCVLNVQLKNAATKFTVSDLFRHQVIRTILLSVFLLQIGIWVRNYSILLYVMEKTNEDPVAVSLISVAEFAPIFLFSFIGGTFADRWRPKRTMIWCDLLSALSIFIVLLTLMFGSWKAIFFATLVSSVLSQFSQPSGMKLFKLHVAEELVQMGMSMYQTIFAVFMILGPIIGTFIYQHYGINMAIAIMGIAFLLSAAVLFLLPPDRTPEEQDKKTTLWQEMKEGFHYVLNNRSLTLLGGVFTAAGFALGLTQPLAVFLITERLGLPKEHLQWLMAAFGSATILGGGLIMGLAKKTSPQLLLVIGMAVNVCGFLIMGLSTQFWLTLSAQFLCGLVMPCIHIGINTMILQNSESAFIGRVNGILTPLFMGGMVLTMSVAGWLKDAFSLVAMYGASSVLFAIGILFMLPLLKGSVSTTNQEIRNIN